MTKKDYEKIAAVILTHANAAWGIHEARLVTSLACDLAKTFSAENPRFNRDKFIEACLGPKATA